MKNKLPSSGRRFVELHSDPSLLLTTGRTPLQAHSAIYVLHISFRGIWEVGEERGKQPKRMELFGPVKKIADFQGIKKKKKSNFA